MNPRYGAEILGSLHSTFPLHLISSPGQLQIQPGHINHTCNCIAVSLEVSENRGTSLSHVSPVFLGQFLSIVQSYSRCTYVCKKVVVHVCVCKLKSICQHMWYVYEYVYPRWRTKLKMSRCPDYKI